MQVRDFAQFVSFQQVKAGQKTKIMLRVLFGAKRGGTGRNNHPPQNMAFFPFRARIRKMALKKPLFVQNRPNKVSECFDPLDWNMFL
mgnify:CR=1 FL=1